MSLLNWLKRPNSNEKTNESGSSKWWNPKKAKDDVATADTSSSEEGCCTKDKDQGTLALEDDLDDDIPTCWTKTQCEGFKSTNEWLIIKNRSLGCSVCEKVQALCVDSAKNLRLSKPWQECTVTENGKTKESQRSSLRKKIFEHKKSEAHIKAIEISLQAEKRVMEHLVDGMNQTHFSATERVFRTVYKIVKHQRPFVHLPVDVDLQILNGISMGRILHSDKTCAEIAMHKASEMKKMSCSEIVTSKRKISILIDESTTLSQKTALVVVIRSFYREQGTAFNLDLIELSDTSAQNITEQLLICLKQNGFEQEFLQECFIGFACDGASVMLGKKSGVAASVKSQFPDILTWHCSNHRLELAVIDVVDEVVGINHFKIFMDKRYALYHQSPKNQNELKVAAATLETQLLKIGRIFSVRWIASSRRTVNAVLQNYASLCQHFQSASEDPKRDGRERSKYSSLHKMIASLQFVSNLSAMSDALDELGELSEYLQISNITLVDADKAIRTSIRVLDSMANEVGLKLPAALQALDNKKFKGLQLHNGKVKLINHAQLYTSLANNVRTRLITTSSSHVSRNDADHRENVDKYTNLLDCMKVLDKKLWQRNDEREVDIQFGDKEIRSLCHLFHLNEQQVIRGFRFYKMEDESGVPEDLEPLMRAVATIPISTSEYDRNFSATNEIVTPLRSRLSIKTTASLLFINSVGPPLSQFKPEKFVRSWSAKGHHSASDINSGKREYKKETRYQEIWDLL